MATSAQAASLTEAYRIEQMRNNALVAYITARLWLKMIDQTDIAASAANFVTRLVPLLEQQRDKSAISARSYYHEFRKLEVRKRDDFELPTMTLMDLRALETSLRVTGEVALKNRIAKLPKTDVGPDLQPRIHPSFIQAAIEETATDVSGAAMRHVSNGGRDELQSAIEQDPVALGYIRVTDANPCYFCAMLASRGPVYGDDSFDQSDPRFIGEGTHKVHDHDQCTVEPVFSRKTQWPGRARDAEDAWVSLSKELGKVPTINDFRKRWEGRA